MKLKTLLCSILTLIYAESSFAAPSSWLSYLHKKDNQIHTILQKRLNEQTFEAKDLFKMDLEELAPKLNSLRIMWMRGEDRFMTKLSKLLYGATNLRKLDLDFNQLTELPVAIGYLPNLQILNISYNPLTELPKEIGNLTNLQILELCLNQITELPKEIGNLTNLKALYLVKSKLTNLPKEIGRLQNLQTLDLRVNQLTELPKEIGNLINLQELYLSFNKLTDLPKEVGNLINLKYLDLRMSGVIGISSYSFNNGNATNLSLNNKGLTQVPLDIIQMKRLEELDLSNNDLESLPALIVNCRTLKKINLSGNAKISSVNKIPNTIFGLQKLESLILTMATGQKEYNKKEISEIRNKKIEEANEKLRNIQEINNQNIIKYILLGKNKTKLSNEDLRQNLEKDKQLIEKLQLKTRFLDQMLDKLIAAR